MTRHRPCDLLVLDLDGTLLDSRGRVSPRNARAVARMEAAGVPVVLATGRSWHESRGAMAALGYRRPLIAAGGAVLSDGATGRTLMRRAMSRAIVEDAVSGLLRHDHAVLLLKDNPPELDHYVVVGDRPLDRASEWWFRAFDLRYARVPSLAEDPHPEETVRLGVVATGAALSTIAHELRDVLAERALLQHWSAVTEEDAVGSSTHLLEIFDNGVSKWTMVEALCGHESWQAPRIVAIGDGLNDVELLQNAALGIAMGNASEVARAAATATTGHHDADGVADAIEALLDGALMVPPPVS